MIARTPPSPPSRRRAGSPRPRTALPALAFATFALLSLLYSTGDARANGRFPQAQAIVGAADRDPSATRPEAPLFLRTTFGVVVSRDDGASWRWICEQALGFSGTWDPPLSVTKDGRLWVGLSDGLRVSKDGCDAEEAPSLHGDVVADLTTTPDGAELVAITATPNQPSGLAWIDATNASAKVIRQTIPVDGIKLETVEVAPSRKTRAYLTGHPIGRGPRPHLFRADRGGAIVEVRSKFPVDARLFIAGIDPKDEQRILLRALHAGGSDVLLSTDGGKTFASVLHMKASMFGFAKSADGATYWAGSGDPTEGVWRSKDRGATWQPMAKVRVYCLHARGDELFACSDPYGPSAFAVAVSRDGGATFTSPRAFTDIAGPIACDAGAGAACGERWPEVRDTFTPKTAEALAADASGAADAGSAAGDGGASPIGDATSRRACSCDVVRSERSAGSWLALAGVLALAVRRTGSRAPQGEPRMDQRGEEGARSTRRRRGALGTKRSDSVTTDRAGRYL